MALIQDARRVWFRLWSVRLALASAVLSAAEVTVNYLAPDHPTPAFAAGAGVVALLAAVARIWAQPKLWGNGDE
jgi:membrane protein YdbS with pleckstrin-like domain